MTDFDDLDKLLGVTIDLPKRKGKAPSVVECGQEPPRERRHTEWNNFHTFTFSGYVARVTRFHCLCCDGLFDVLEGIFIEESHAGGTRRLTAMAPGGDWPAAGGHRKEVTDAEVAYCGDCIGALGFDREVDGKGMPYTLMTGRGRV